MYPAFCRICAYMCVYVRICLIFRYLLKIANISAKININRYTKSLEIRKNAVPLQKFIEILKAI